MNNLSKRDKDKQTHETEILNAAEKIFCTKGYDAAGMDEIAREARFTKRTVYQYFENKEDLYAAVVKVALNRLMSRIRGINRFETTGYDKLERFCINYHQLYRENPQMIRLIEQWSRLKDSASVSAKHKEELVRIGREITRGIAEMIEEGKHDGSIQSGLDTERSAACLKFMITGFYNQLSAAEGKLDSEDAEKSEDLSSYVIELLIKPMKRCKTVIATRKGTA